MDPYKSPSSQVDTPTTVPPGVKFGAIARDIAILWVLTFLGGFVIGVSAAGVNPPSPTYQLALAVSNILFGTVGFVISGSLARGPRWRHLALVAAVFWVTTIINIPLLGVTLDRWLLGGLLIALMMGVGGALSYVFRRSERASG